MLGSKFYSIRMKFVVINDIHVGAETLYKGVNRKLSRLSKRLLREFVAKVNSEIKPDFVANLGDLVGDIDRESDINNMQYVVTELARLNCPIHHIVGNHEQRNLSEDDMKRILCYDNLYFSTDYNDIKFIYLHTEDSKERDKENSSISISDKQLSWFENELNSTDKKVVVFSHHSFADQDVTNNFWFSGREQRCLVHNRKDVRNVIDRSAKVIACINAHLHWNNVTVHNNIPYITLQSLVENFNNDNVPSETFSVFELENDFIKLHVLGNDRFEFVKYL